MEQEVEQKRRNVKIRVQRINKKSKLIDTFRMSDA